MLDWALKKADWLDPTKEIEDELLGSFPPDFLNDSKNFW